MRSPSCIGVFLLLLLLFLPAQGRASPAASERGPAGRSRVETHHYQAVAAGKEDAKEEIRLTFSFEEASAQYASTIISANSDERISIKMSGEGNLISATRSLLKGPGGAIEENIRREGNAVYVEQTSGPDRKTQELDIPEGRTLALEGSFLVLLRFFPYDSASSWELFVIDFSGRSVNATAHQAGIERVTVPAGEFSCYRMELRIHAFMLSPTITCWVAMEKPHFVVKSEGKRGLLTPTYITTLIDRK